MKASVYRMKRKKFIFWFALIAVVISSFCGAWVVAKTAEDGSGYRTIKVIATQGVVTVVKGEIEYSAYPGMLLKEGHVLVTAGGGSARLVLDDDKYIKVESGSRVAFETLGLLGSGKTAIRLERGALASEIVNPLSDEEEFVVNTPNAVLAVRGTFFRVDLEVSKDGVVQSKVMTYGGQVATRRVFPSGEVEEAEALVDSGFKTAINMDKDTTVYVIEKTDEAQDTNGDGTLNVEPIQKADISDEDLIDMYHASENGHELFVPTEEIKEDITERNIDLQTTISVYEKASLLETENQEEEIENPVANDSTPLAIVPEEVQNAEIDSETEREEEDVAQLESSQVGLLTDGGFDEEIVHKHTEEETKLNPTCVLDGYQIVNCSECGEELSRQVLPAIGHTPETHMQASTCTEEGKETEICTVCGEILQEIILEAKGHIGVTEKREASCTEAGIETEICTVCGQILRERVVEAIGHSGHIERIEPTCTETGMESEICTVCGEILSEIILEAKGHTSSVTRVEGTCVAQGYERVSCSDCQTILSQTSLPMGDHRIEFVGDEFEHSKCADCGVTLATTHSYTETVIQGLTCGRDGITRFACECGYSYDETVTATGHVRDTGNDTLCSNCGELWASLDSATFPDAAFLAFVEQYDADGDGSLVGSELSGVSTLNLAGTSSQDGGYSDLTGIKYFVNLTTLNCSYNAGITGLELQDNDNLQTLTCYNTGLSWLQVSDAGVLSSINVFACPIQELLLTDQTSLATLNIGNCTSLEMLDISNTAIATLDVSTAEALAWINVSGTQLTQLDATNLIQLVSLDVSGCRALETLAAEACDLLGEVYLSDCTALKNVSLIGCDSLQTLDVADCTQLYELDVTNTGLTSLDVSGLTSLYMLGGEDCTELTTVDVSGCTSLYSASFARSAQLNTVNASGNTGMYELRLTDCTGLTSVNVTSCGSGSGNFVLYATGTGKASSFFTGYDSGYMMFQGD